MEQRTFEEVDTVGALQKFGPIDAAIENEIATEIAAEKLAAGEVVEETKLDAVDDEMKKLFDAGMPKADKDEDPEAV
jgi:hypothetical protein